MLIWAALSAAALTEALKALTGIIPAESRESAELS